MKKLLALLLGCASVEAKSIITDDYLDKVAMIESNFNYDAVGDKGKAIGAYQMHEAAWREGCFRLAHTSSCRDHWLGFADKHKELAKDAIISRMVCKAYLEVLENQMKKDPWNKAGVTPVSLYMAYNMGYMGAYAYRFKYDNLSLDSRRRSILMRANYIFSR